MTRGTPIDIWYAILRTRTMYAHFFDMQGGHAIMAGLLKYGTFVPFFPLIATLRAALGEIPYFCNAATACAMAAWEAHAAPPRNFCIRRLVVRYSITYNTAQHHQTLGLIV